MADIAAIFGWSPPVLDALTIPQTMAWHKRAIDRALLIHGGGRG